MDWQAFGDGMRAYVARRTGIAYADVIWQGEAEGMRGRPCCYLQMVGDATYATWPDEIRYESNGAGADASVRAVGTRSFAVQCRVITRDQRLPGRAFVLLERLRDSLYLPSSSDAFASMCVSLETPGALLELGRSWDFRQESEAALELRFAYTYDTACGCCSSGSSPSPSETVGTIEHVIAGGTVWPPFNTDPSAIIVPPQQVDRS
jgi:hypothetical protein